MKFKDSNLGPLQIDSQQLLPSQYYLVTKGSSVKEKNKTALLVKLRERGVHTTVWRFLKTELVDMCCVYDIPITVISVILTSGWCGKPKGVPQLFLNAGTLIRYQ